MLSQYIQSCLPIRMDLAFQENISFIFLNISYLPHLFFSEKHGEMPKMGHKTKYVHYTEGEMKNISPPKM